MAPKLSEKKRKSRDSDSESDDELANGLFDGILSHSEDEEDFVASDHGDEDEEADESGSEDTEYSEDEDEEGEEDDAILSDDVPSDADGEDEPEILEPGVDPKPKEKESDEKNYRIEKDANGGIRYVYECVVFARQDGSAVQECIKLTSSRQ